MCNPNPEVSMGTCAASTATDPKRKSQGLPPVPLFPPEPRLQGVLI